MSIEETKAWNAALDEARMKFRTGNFSWDYVDKELSFLRKPLPSPEPPKTAISEPKWEELDPFTAVLLRRCGGTETIAEDRVATYPADRNKKKTLKILSRESF